MDKSHSSTPRSHSASTPLSMTTTFSGYGVQQPTTTIIPIETMHPLVHLVMNIDIYKTPLANSICQYSVLFKCSTLSHSPPCLPGTKRANGPLPNFFITSLTTTVAISFGFLSSIHHIILFLLFEDLINRSETYCNKWSFQANPTFPRLFSHRTHDGGEDTTKYNCK